MKTHLILSAIAAAALAFVSTAATAQVVIVDTLPPVGTNRSNVNTTQANAVPFTFTDAFDNVTVEASLTATDNSTLTGTAFLTTAIGPGTTVADVVATAPFTFASVAAFTEVSYVTLFSGLDLPADDYFLIVAGDGTGGGITLNPAATYTTDPDATVSTSQFAAGTNLDTTFIPASNFGNSGLGNRFIRLTSVPVPEPTSLGLLGMGGLVMLRRRRA